MYEAVGGESGRHSIDAPVGKPATKIFCAQDDPTTCQWQSELIGKTKKLFFNSSVQSAPDQQFDFFRPGKHHSAGMSESLEYEIAPWEWSRKFRTGGPEQDSSWTRSPTRAAASGKPMAKRIYPSPLTNERMR